MSPKENILTCQGNQENLLKDSSTSKDISGEIISKLEELNKKLDKLLEGEDDEKES